MKRTVARVLLMLAALSLASTAAAGHPAGLVVSALVPLGYQLGTIGHRHAPELTYLGALLPLVAGGVALAGRPSAAIPLAALFVGFLVASLLEGGPRAS